MNATTIIFFFLMIFAPIAVAYYVGARSKEERMGEVALTSEVSIMLPAEVLTDPVIEQEISLPVETRVATLEEHAVQAEEDARVAQAVAARAKAAALVAIARAATARAAVAAEAAEAAARAAAEATQIAQAAREAQRLANVPAAQELPPDHPSLDFPRSRVARRAA